MAPTLNMALTDEEGTGAGNSAGGGCPQNWPAPALIPEPPLGHTPPKGGFLGVDYGPPEAWGHGEPWRPLQPPGWDQTS